PPTQVVWYSGKYARRFNVKKGAQYLRQFLQACKEELETAVMALGKTSIREVGREDLMALNELIAKGCGLAMVYDPFLSPGPSPVLR
ncbi:MAG TPA: FMN-binding glutamate synthase family protein, partial [Firmicutes bacterium]|nr:FMN-binding glutamate synthase family protein [Bacillota bacterium]